MGGSGLRTHPISSLGPPARPGQDQVPRYIHESSLEEMPAKDSSATGAHNRDTGQPKLSGVSRRGKKRRETRFLSFCLISSRDPSHSEPTYPHTLYNHNVSGDACNGVFSPYYSDDTNGYRARNGPSIRGPLAAGQPPRPADLKSKRRSVVEPADGGPHLARPEMPRLLSAWRKRTRRWTGGDLAEAASRSTDSRNAAPRPKSVR
jgi:hypothetical protein